MNHVPTKVDNCNGLENIFHNIGGKFIGCKIEFVLPAWLICIFPFPSYNLDYNVLGGGGGPGTGIVKFNACVTSGFIFTAFWLLVIWHCIFPATWLVFFAECQSLVKKYLAMNWGVLACYLAAEKMAVYFWEWPGVLAHRHSLYTGSNWGYQCRFSPCKGQGISCPPLFLVWDSSGSHPKPVDFSRDPLHWQSLSLLVFHPILHMVQKLLCFFASQLVPSGIQWWNSGKWAPNVRLTFVLGFLLLHLGLMSLYCHVSNLMLSVMGFRFCSTSPLFSWEIRSFTCTHVYSGIECFLSFPPDSGIVFPVPKCTAGVVMSSLASHLH